MGVGCFGHLAEAQINALRQQHIEQTNFIFAGHACSQVCKGYRQVVERSLNFFKPITLPSRNLTRNIMPGSKRI